uniref:Uncharacterized protein n=1 Tax=Oncorhynchus tshawytscha TaxID=74940 RepID=A0AAZ3S354_ONCTS
MDQPPLYQPEFVPMKGNKYMRLEDTHGAPKFQHTVVLGQPQPVVPHPRDHIIWSLCSLVYGNPFCLGMLAVYFSIKPVVPHPRDHIIWSLCSLVYGNPFCLGMLAVYFSIKSRDRKMVGDLEGARKHGKTACCFNTVTLTLVILGLLFFFITYGIIIYQVTH